MSYPTALRHLRETFRRRRPGQVRGEVFSRGQEAWIGRVGTLVIETHGAAAEKTVRDAMAAAGRFRCSTRGEKLVFQRETPAAVVPSA